MEFLCNTRESMFSMMGKCLSFIIVGYIFYTLVLIFEDTIAVYVYFSFEIFRVEQQNINMSISGHFYFALRWIVIKFDLLTGGQNRCYLNGREKHIEPQGHLQTSVTEYWFIVEVRKKILLCKSVQSSMLNYDS